ncbi:MAG TPA: amidase family protein, partial [Burkholderiaceae bacterium]|nr:amidase family protein [Burkholderiaceae bacterium]
IAGVDADDPTTLRADVPDYQAADERDLRGFRVGFDEGYALADVEAEVRRAVEETLRTLRSLGASIVPLTFPDVARAVADWPLNCAVETAVAHAATFPSRRDAYGPGLAGFIDAGRGLSGPEYQHILLRRREFSGRVQRVLDAVDVMLIPAIPFTVPTVQRMATLGQVAAELAALIRFTAPLSMTGNPTLTVPAGFTAKGLPVAVQFVGQHLGEAAICRAGRAFQRATDWHRRHPRI